MARKAVRVPNGDEKMSTHPEFWEVEGRTPEIGETYMWLGDAEADNNNTCTCYEPQFVQINDIDAEDVYGQFYVSNDKRDACCGSQWTVVERLTTPNNNTEAAEHYKLANELHQGVMNMTFTYAEITQKVSALQRLLAAERFKTLAVPLPTGACSTCFDDIKFVGGKWQHEVEKECNTRAVLLTS